MSGWGLIGRLKRRLAPPPTIGHVFEVQVVHPPKGGYFRDIYVREVDFETAFWRAYEIARDWNEREFEIVSTRPADLRDFPQAGLTPWVGRRRHFGLLGLYVPQLPYWPGRRS